MATIVVPYRSGGKTRLPAGIREELALAMLGDVLSVATSVARTRLVTDDDAGVVVAQGLGVEVVDDPGGGQGTAVMAALAPVSGPALVVNADLPLATPADLVALLEHARGGSFVLVEAPDGTTNALGLPFAGAFAPLYGPGSARRFRAHAQALRLPCRAAALPDLRVDVDTLDDLEPVADRAGSRTRALLSLIAA